MKKLLCALLVVTAIVAGTAANAEWKFERKIDLICPFGVGGGFDTTLRPLAPLLKEILGVEVEVINVTGGSGANGVEFAYKQPADGYTFLAGTQNFVILDLQGLFSMDYKYEFIPVCKMLHSTNIIAGSKKALDAKGCKTYADLLAYIKEHPYEVSVGMITSTGVDGVSLRQSIKGYDVNEVSYNGGAEMNSALVGGHIDIVITGTDEIDGLVRSGDIIPLCAVSETRMKKYPEMQCTGELGINSFVGPWRGLLAKKGTPVEAMEALADAVAKAVERPEWKEFLHLSGQDDRPGYLNRKDSIDMFEEEYAVFTDYLRKENVLQKDYSNK